MRMSSCYICICANKPNYWEILFFLWTSLLGILFLRSQSDGTHPWPTLTKNQWVKSCRQVFIQNRMSMYYFNMRIKSTFAAFFPLTAYIVILKKSRFFSTQGNHSFFFWVCLWVLVFNTVKYSSTQLQRWDWMKLFAYHSNFQGSRLHKKCTVIKAFRRLGHCNVDKK